MELPEEHYAFLSLGIRNAQERIRLIKNEKDKSASRRMRLEKKRINAYRDLLKGPAKDLTDEERRKYAHFFGTDPVVKVKTLLDKDRKPIGRRLYWKSGHIEDVGKGDLSMAIKISGYIIKDR